MVNNIPEHNMKILLGVTIAKVVKENIHRNVTGEERIDNDSSCANWLHFTYEV